MRDKKNYIQNARTDLLRPGCLGLPTVFSTVHVPVRTGTTPVLYHLNSGVPVQLMGGSSWLWALFGRLSGLI